MGITCKGHQHALTDKSIWKGGDRLGGQQHLLDQPATVTQRRIKLRLQIRRPICVHLSKVGAPVAFDAGQALHMGDRAAVLLIANGTQAVGLDDKPDRKSFFSDPRYRQSLL